jgi:predicted Ser/Thr protein kinase
MTRDLVYELHTMDFELAHEAAEEIKRLRKALADVALRCESAGAVASKALRGEKP